MESQSCRAGGDGEGDSRFERPRPGPTFEPQTDAVSWCWAMCRGGLPGGKGEQYRLKSQESWNLGAGCIRGK